MCFVIQAFPCQSRTVLFKRKGNHCQNKPGCLCPVQTCLEKEAEVLTFRQELRKDVLTLMTELKLLYAIVNVFYTFSPQINHATVLFV